MAKIVVKAAPATKKPSGLARLQNLASSFIADNEPPAVQHAPETRDAAPLLAESLQQPGGSGMFGALLKPNASIEEVKSAGTYARIKVSAIDPDPNQPRKTIDRVQLDELRATIEAAGKLLSPVSLRPNPLVSGRYLLIFGERRWRAVKQLGWEEIDANLVHEISDADVLVHQLIENSDKARVNVEPWEEAESMGRLLEMLHSQTAVAKALGHPKDYVSKRLALLELPAVVRTLRVSASLKDLETSLMLGRLAKENPPAFEKVVEKATKVGAIGRKQVAAALAASRVAQSNSGHSQNAAVPTELKDSYEQLIAALAKSYAGGVTVKELSMGQGGAVTLGVSFTSMAHLDAFLQRLF